MTVSRFSYSGLVTLSVTLSASHRSAIITEPGPFRSLYNMPIADTMSFAKENFFKKQLNVEEQFQFLNPPPEHRVWGCLWNKEVGL